MNITGSGKSQCILEKMEVEQLLQVRYRMAVKHSAKGLSFAKKGYLKAGRGIVTDIFNTTEDLRACQTLGYGYVVLDVLDPFLKSFYEKMGTNVMMESYNPETEFVYIGMIATNGGVVSTIIKG